MFFRFFFFKQKTAYEMRISDWSSDVCSSDLRALDALVKTKLDGTGERLRWLEASREEFESSKDPAIQYAVAVMPSLLEREAERKARAGDALLARPVYLQAVADYRQDQGGAVYPDANGSVGITFGHVHPYPQHNGAKPLTFGRNNVQ